MKKTSTLLICLALLLSCFVGCAKESVSPGGSPSPGNTSPSPNPGGNTEGTLPEVLRQLHDIYNARPDVKSAVEQFEANAPRLVEIQNRMEEIQGEIWNEGIAAERYAELEAELEAIMNEQNDIYALQSALLPETIEVALSRDMNTGDNEFGQKINWYIGDGNETLPFAEGYASEPEMSPATYSLVLLRMEAGANIEAAKLAIKGGTVNDYAMNSKWVCVSVDPENFIVDNIGDLIIVIISGNSKAIHEAFLELAK